MHCFLVGAPTTASSCSNEPFYDNCAPFTQRGRDREGKMESRVVTRPSSLRSPQTVLAPVVAEVPTWVSDERASGGGPDHSYCYWRGSLGEPEHGPGINRMRGVERGEEQGRYWRDTSQRYDISSPTASIDHRSTLSFYDIKGADRIKDVFEMESSFQEHFQDHVWTPDMGMDEQSDPWSESSSDTQNQEIGNELEPETDSVSCGFLERDQILQLQQCDSPQPYRQASWTQNEVQHPQETQWAPKVPPPPPLADPSASALRSLLTNLQQHIVRQHEVYEARIFR